MTAYWPYAAAVVCLLSVVRCAARQHCGLRSLLGGAVCGLGVLALLGLLEPITGISLPLNRFTAFCDGTADPAAAAVGAHTGLYNFSCQSAGNMVYFLGKRVEHTAAGQPARAA